MIETEDEMIVTYNGCGQIEPYSDAELGLFKHCAEGMISITPEYFDAVFKRVAEQHHILIRLLKNGEKP